MEKRAAGDRVTRFISSTFHSLHPDLFSAKIMYLIFCVVLPLLLYGFDLYMMGDMPGLYTHGQDWFVVVELFIYRPVQLLFLPLILFGVFGTFAVLRDGSRALQKRWVRLGIGLATAWCWVLTACIVLLLVSVGVGAHLTLPQFVVTSFIGSVGLAIGLCILFGFSLFLKKYVERVGKKQVLFALVGLVILFPILMRLDSGHSGIFGLNLFEAIASFIGLSFLNAPLIAAVFGTVLCLHAGNIQKWKKSDSVEISLTLFAFLLAGLYKMYTIYIHVERTIFYP